MMKKKFLVLLTLALALTAALTACGGAKGGDAGNSAMPQAAPSLNSKAEESGWDASAPMEPMADMDMPAGAEGASGIYSGIPENAKVIYTAGLEMETKEFDSASKALEAAVAEVGGYFESRSVNQGGLYRSMSCTVRVPVERFTSFLDKAGETAHVTRRQEDNEDVSEAYYDNEARLTTQRTKLERLQELLSKAEAMEDIITIESAISDTELQIEYLTGSLRKYDSQINFSTVTIELYEVYRLSTDEEAPLTFGDRLGSAFGTGLQRGMDGLEDFAISIARNWVSLLIWAAVIAAAVLLLRKRSLRKKAERIAASLPVVRPGERREQDSSSGNEKKDENKKE